jgi:hypothetical protein
MLPVRAFDPNSESAQLPPSFLHHSLSMNNHSARGRVPAYRLPVSPRFVALLPPNLPCKNDMCLRVAGGLLSCALVSVLSSSRSSWPVQLARRRRNRSRITHRRRRIITRRRPGNIIHRRQMATIRHRHLMDIICRHRPMPAHQCHRWMSAHRRRNLRTITRTSNPAKHRHPIRQHGNIMRRRIAPPRNRHRRIFRARRAPSAAAQPT